jgi:purine nucleosidase
MKKLFVLLIFIIQFAQAQKQKVIFDCDLGDDIDDAYALSLLVASKELDVLGISTAYGRTEDRATLACKMLYEFGLEQKIPVFIGRNTSKTDERANWYADQFYWSEGFNKVKPQTKPAADFIIETLKKYPNEVTLIAVGPVTNLKDILEKDPSALKLAKRIVLMFGSFYIGYDGSPTINNEWNVKCDVDAAKKFVNAGLNPVYAGLDVTTFVTYSKASRERLLYRQSPLTNALCGLQNLWAYERDPILFDAVAVGMVLWPDLFKTKSVNFSVDEKGYTIINPNLPPNAEIGVAINKNEFLKRLTDVYMKQNLGR